MVGELTRRENRTSVAASAHAVHDAEDGEVAHAERPSTRTAFLVAHDFSYFRNRHTQGLLCKHRSLPFSYAASYSIVSSARRNGKELDAFERALCASPVTTDTKGCANLVEHPSAEREIVYD
jgi:hypothetical protein